MKLVFSYILMFYLKKKNKWEEIFAPSCSSEIEVLAPLRIITS